MIKMYFTAMLLVLVPGLLFAQQRETVYRKDSSRQLLKAAYSTFMLFSQMNQRENYHWANGQVCTPTGRQAGERLSPYVRVWGDSAAVVSDPREIEMVLNRKNGQQVTREKTYW
ncbi:MAG TPA: hypothetical protein VFS36_03670 [Chitinophagaceae bacterium]|nr:hypothetical protein [Chitinophagaceae bacterium]